MPVSSEAQEIVFKNDLVALIPQLRAFAYSLSRDKAAADDLAQDALAKAWSARGSYEPGTNLKAWTFMILRNAFFSHKRRSWRVCELDPEVAAATLVSVTNPTGSLELDELRRALAMLPPDQSEALIMIGAADLSYEEAAEICGVAIGTVKSRVSRARVKLAEILDEGDLIADLMAPSAAMGAILARAEQLRAA